MQVLPLADAADLGVQRRSGAKVAARGGYTAATQAGVSTQGANTARVMDVLWDKVSSLKRAWALADVERHSAGHLLRAMSASVRELLAALYERAAVVAAAGRRERPPPRWRICAAAALLYCGATQRTRCCRRYV